MDNAVDALHLAFVAMVLVIALSVAVYMITMARQTSEIVLRTADDTKYLSYETTEKGGNGIYYEGRIVGFETVIPTLFKYNFENYTIVFLDATSFFNPTTKEILKADPISLYDTTTNDQYWSPDSEFVYYSIEDGVFKKEKRTIPTDEYSTYTGDYGTGVFAIDLEEERDRGEPWTTGARRNSEIRKHMEALLFGGSYTNPSGNGEIIDYNGGLIGQFGRDAKFVELVGHYTKEEISDEEDDEYQSPIHRVGNQTVSKTIIVYIHIPD